MFFKYCGRGNRPTSVKKYPTPVNAFVPSSVPKLSPKPTSQNEKPLKMMSIAFFTIMFVSFLTVTMPVDLAEF